jgi:hypothetical protein
MKKWRLVPVYASTGEFPPNRLKQNPVLSERVLCTVVGFEDTTIVEGFRSFVEEESVKRKPWIIIGIEKNKNALFADKEVIWFKKEYYD